MFKKLLSPEAAAERFHEWLRSKEILDDAHDLPWVSAPSGYRAELVAALNSDRRSVAFSTDLSAKTICASCAKELSECQCERPP